MKVLDPQKLDSSEPGLWEALAKAGLFVEQIDREWECKDPQAVDAFIKSYDPLPAARETKIAAIRAEGLKLVQLVFPGVLNAEMMDLEYHRWVSIVGKSATPEYQRILDVWAVQEGAVAAVKAAPDLKAIEGVIAEWPA